MANQVPMVSYLVLGNDPHLMAHECVKCKARYFDRRNGCAKCFGTEFRDVGVSKEGKVRTFSIVHTAAPGIKVPFFRCCGERTINQIASASRREPTPLKSGAIFAESRFFQASGASWHDVQLNSAINR